jgi:hypothetical protein
MANLPKDCRLSLAGTTMRRLANWITNNRLVTILLVAYMILSGIAFEQGRVIQSQRTLIHDLFSDSLALSSTRTQDLPSHRRN